MRTVGQRLAGPHPGRSEHSPSPTFRRSSCTALDMWLYKVLVAIPVPVRSRRICPIFRTAFGLSLSRHLHN
jgi:hypothetical protein